MPSLVREEGRRAHSARDEDLAAMLDCHVINVLGGTLDIELASGRYP